MEWTLREEKALFKRVYLKYRKKIMNNGKLISLSIIEDEILEIKEIVHDGKSTRMRLSNMAWCDLKLKGTLRNASKQTCRIINSLL